MAYTSPNVPSDNYIIIDTTTGSVIAEKGADEELGIASLTKIMTSYVVFKEIQNGTLSLNDQVTVSKKAWETKGSRMFIEVGTQVTVDELLNGLISVSGNDAAVALAEHITGSEDRFAELMDAYAAKLGMENTKFANVSGLPSKKEAYSSARDLSILSKALITEHPEMYKKFSIKSFTYNDITQKNRNALIHESSSYDGLKTGYTMGAGYCLAASFAKDDRRLITIILGADSPAQRFSDAKTLTNFGFRRFKNVKPVNEESAIHEIDVFFGEKDSVKVYPQEDFQFTIPRSLTNEDESKDITLKAELNGNGDNGAMLFAPFEDNFVVGELTVQYKGETVATVPLVTREGVNEGSWWTKLEDWVTLKYISLAG
ncbi:D-alanyl-D-alanine carboxypeptidase family protein [Vibrio crassostreae]|uniref:D-alanyl-D-alanine carboxypeptidase family protein n=1 Tax=Vibrio crassostreae TaxID=246167 RepID=UPI001B31621B|nr:D-alanyl-D-alanine carboxypeptidase family protein [Vibrio crassostreae]